MLLSEQAISYAKPLAVLQNACFETPWSEDEFKTLLALPTTVVWLTEQSFLVCSRVLDEMEILTIGVLPKARRQGEGMQLLSQLKDYAVSQNIKRIFLEVSANNQPAFHLYQRAGFRQIGKRPGYYRTANGMVDALCLMLTFSDSK